MIPLLFFVLISCTQQPNKDDKLATKDTSKEISNNNNPPKNNTEIISDDVIDNPKNKSRRKINKANKNKKHKNKGIKYYATLYEDIFLQYLKGKEGAGEKIIKIIDDKNGFANFIVEDKIYTKQPSSQKAALAIWLDNNKNEFFGVFTYENDGTNERGEIKNLKFYENKINATTGNDWEDITTQIVPIPAIEALFSKRKPQKTKENEYFNPYLMVIIPQEGTTIRLSQQINIDNQPQIIGELVFDKKTGKFNLIEK